MARTATAKKTVAPKTATKRRGANGKSNGKNGRRKKNGKNGKPVDPSKLTLPPKERRELASKRANSLRNRIRKLPIIDDIYLWMKQSYPMSEISKLIHAQGYLEDVDHKVLVNTLKQMALKTMTPAELAAGKMPNYVLESLDKLKQGIKEIEEAGWLFSSQKAILEKCMRDMMELLALPPNWDLIPKEEIPPEAQMIFRSARAIVLNAQEAGMPEGMPLSFYLMASDVYARMLHHVEGLRKLIKTSAEIKLELGGNEEKVQETTHEAQLAEFTKKHFRGKQVVYDVLSDPKSRRRVGNVFLKIVENVRLQESLEQGEKMLPEGEPSDN